MTGLGPHVTPISLRNPHVWLGSRCIQSQGSFRSYRLYLAAREIFKSVILATQPWETCAQQSGHRPAHHWANPRTSQSGQRLVVCPTLWTQWRTYHYQILPGAWRHIFFDVGFIIHTTKVVLLRVKILDRVHVDYSTASWGWNVHSSRCFLSTKLR